MKEITSNKKYVLSLVDPDEVFDILGKSDGGGLFCRVLKGKFQKTTHELRNLKVVDIKTYIEAAKNNDYDFIIFYRVTENKGDRKLRFYNNGDYVEVAEKDILEAKKICCSGPCGSQLCPFHGHMYGGCHELIKKYNRGEYEEVDKND